MNNLVTQIYHQWESSPTYERPKKLPNHIT